MKLIVTGCRNVIDYTLFCTALMQSEFKPSLILHGDCSGVDRLGKRYALENNIDQKAFPANWNLHGRAAGPIRNQEMIDYIKSDSHPRLLAIWDGISRGTFDCIKRAHTAKIPIYVYMLQ